MTAKKKVSVLVIILVLAGGCVKEINLEPADIKKRKVLVMVSGDPKGYVWSMGGTMGAALAFGLIGASAAMIVASEKGEIFARALTDYKLNLKVRDALVAEMSESSDREVVPVCFGHEDSDESGCVEVWSVEALQSEYPGQLVLVVSPNEYGLRNQKPYLALYLGYFDIDSEKAVWQHQITLKNNEIPEHTRTLKEWTSSPDDLCSCLDNQIEKMAPKISGFTKSNDIPAQDTAWVFAGGSPLKLEKMF